MITPQITDKLPVTQQQLTPAQEKVFQYVYQGYITGESRTLRDICKHCEYRSVNAAVGIIRRLIHKGVLSKTSNQSRSLRPLERPWGA